MTSALDTQMELDAAAAHEQVGTSIVVRVEGPGGAETTCDAIANPGNLKAAGNAEHAPAYEIMVSVPKSQLSTVKPNLTEADIPGEWVGSSGTVTRRVKNTIGNRWYPGAWLLAIAGGG